MFIIADAGLFAFLITRAGGPDAIGRWLELALQSPTMFLALGMIPPPLDVNLFAACTVAKISLDLIITHLLPFVLIIVACLMVVTYVPQLSLFLRDMVYAR